MCVYLYYMYLNTIERILKLANYAVTQSSMLQRLSDLITEG